MSVSLDEDLDNVFQAITSSVLGDELTNYTSLDSLLAATRLYLETFPQKWAQNGKLFNKIFDTININYYKTKLNEALAKNNEFSAKIYRNRLEEYMERRGLTKKSARESKISKRFPCTGNLDDFDENLNNASHLHNRLNSDKTRVKLWSNATRMVNETLSNQNYGIRNTNKPKLWANATKMLQETMRNDCISTASTQKISNCSKRPIWSSAFKLANETMLNDAASVASLRTSNLRRDVLLSNTRYVNDANSDNASVISGKPKIWTNASKLVKEFMNMTNAQQAENDNNSISSKSTLPLTRNTYMGGSDVNSTRNNNNLVPNDNFGGYPHSVASSSFEPKKKLWENAFRKLDHTLNPTLPSGGQQRSNMELNPKQNEISLNPAVFPNSARNVHSERSGLGNQTCGQKKSLWKNATSLLNKMRGLERPHFTNPNIRQLSQHSGVLNNQLYTFKPINELNERDNDGNRDTQEVRYSNRCDKLDKNKSDEIEKSNEDKKLDANDSKKVNKGVNACKEQSPKIIKNLSVNDSTPVRSSKRLKLKDSNKKLSTHGRAQNKRKLSFSKTPGTLDCSTPANSVRKRKRSNKNLTSTPLNSEVGGKRKRSGSLAEMSDSLRPHAKRFRNPSKDRTVNIRLNKKKVRSLRNSTFNSTTVSDRSCDTNISTPTSTLTNRVGKMRILYKRNLGI